MTRTRIQLLLLLTMAVAVGCNSSTQCGRDGLQKAAIQTRNAAQVGLVAQQRCLDTELREDQRAAACKDTSDSFQQIIELQASVIERLSDKDQKADNTADKTKEVPASAPDTAEPKADGSSKVSGKSEPLNSPPKTEAAVSTPTAPTASSKPVTK